MILVCTPELLVQSLFKPGSSVNPDHKEKYVYILAYAVSVYEQVTTGWPCFELCAHIICSILSVGGRAIFIIVHIHNIVHTKQREKRYLSSILLWYFP